MQWTYRMIKFFFSNSDSSLHLIFFMFHRAVILMWRRRFFCSSLGTSFTDHSSNCWHRLYTDATIHPNGSPKIFKSLWQPFDQQLSSVTGSTYTIGGNVWPRFWEIVSFFSEMIKWAIFYCQKMTHLNLFFLVIKNCIVSLDARPFSQPIERNRWLTCRKATPNWRCKAGQ